MIRLGRAQIRQSEGRLQVHVPVDGALEPVLWFDLPSEHAHMLSVRGDAFALALLLPAMKTGQDLHVAATMTDELVHNLNGPAQAWIRSILPSYSRIAVTAEHEASAVAMPRGVATGFSAGIDSFSVLADYLFTAEVPSSMRVTHLLFNNVGSHPGDADALAAARLDGVRSVASGWGVPIVDVRSNLDWFFHGIGTNTAFQNTHTVRNAAVAHLLGGGLGTWFYASSIDFAHVHGGPDQDMGITDVIGLPLLSTTALRLVSTGGERTRVEKTIQVGSIEAVRGSLDVCIDDSPSRVRNCSRCWKCLRTMLTLEILDELQAYCPQRFDEGTYRSRREKYLAYVLASKDPKHREIVELAEERGFVWPVGAHHAAARLRARDVVRSVARTARRRISVQARERAS